MDPQDNRPRSNDAGFVNSTGNSSGEKSSELGLTSSSDNSNFSSTSGSSLGERGEGLGDPRGFEKVLKELGLPDSTILTMRESIENLDIEGYFNQAKDYLKDATAKAKTVVKDNKALVAGALAIVTIGAGVLLAINRSKDKDSDRASDRK